MAIITLTTDFGTADGYTGAMKGVLARLAPAAQLVDIAHDIPPHDIAHAAWVVANACREFPADTVHLVVVDPGVGGARGEVIVHVAEHWFIGPDNGVFAYLGDDYVAWSIARNEAPPARGGEPSATFHGRDVFAPAAAAIARMEYPFGGKVRLAGRLPWGPRPAGEGRVVSVDRYGNLVTDLPSAEAGSAVAIAGRRLQLARTFEDVARGELLAYVGSAGTVEIGVREGRADRGLDAPRGTRVVPVPEGDAYR
jgi:S-adenosylmethionine hydrolase